ncbi:MAG: 50S ribosomal protein L9 [Candidatus Zambryskibacteria bacterium]|nr:50S ribosomal protein L9 [Candidatus Zambryskibacteria bacterium]
MKIILLKDIAKVGKRHEIKNIADGHAQNFIIPRGLGIPATDANVKKIEMMKNSSDADRSVQETLLAKNLETLQNTTISISGKANEKGHLFAGVHKDEIVEAVQKQANITIHPDFLMLDKPLKETGNHIVIVQAGGKKANLKISIEAVK